MGKPYSKSKSHQNFRKIIRDAAQKWNKYISEVIITSPLGVVPRELEEVFPAAHYDISVTGDWDAEEFHLTSDDITKWIIKLPQDVKIIAYLQGGYRKAFKMAVEKIKTKDLTRLSYYISENIHEFTQTLNEDVESLKDHEELRISQDLLSDEEQSIKMIADYQFGKGAGKKLIGSAARFLQSRNDQIKTIVGFESYGKLQLGRYLRNSGHIQLNYQGGERLADHPGITVVLATLDISGTTIFKPGIEHVDEGLCAGDEVVILGPNKEYLGVGSLIVSSRTFSCMRRGAIVKVRKMKKGEN
jgi:archaeosine synthase